MGLDMKTSKKINVRIFKRYQKAGKKGKAKLLNEYGKRWNITGIIWHIFWPIGGKQGMPWWMAKWSSLLPKYP